MMAKHLFIGIPVLVNPWVPENEIWLVQEGKKITVHCHEGPQAGETIEHWLQPPKIGKIINLGEETLTNPLARKFEWPSK